jgi:hypothetical protein
VVRCGGLQGVSGVAGRVEVRQRQSKGRSRSTTLTSEVLQQLNFAQGALGEDLLAEDVGDLFDGDALARLVVGGCAVWEGVLAGVDVDVDVDVDERWA